MGKWGIPKKSYTNVAQQCLLDGCSAFLEDCIGKSRFLEILPSPSTPYVSCLFHALLLSEASGGVELDRGDNKMVCANIQMLGLFQFNIGCICLTSPLCVFK